MTLEVDPFAALARGGEDPAPYLAYAAWLDAQRDPRGELVRLQLALETARGDAALALAAKERAWLVQHRERFFGPFAPLVVGEAGDANAWPTTFGWRRGFLTRIDVGAIPTPVRRADGAPPDDVARLPVAAIAQGLMHPVARHCVAIRGAMTPPRIPPGVAWVHLTHATITERLLADPCLRTLEIDQALGGVALVHAGLEALDVRCDDLGVDVIERSRLPALQRLVCRDIGPSPALVARLVAAILRTGASRVELVFRAHPTTLSPRVGPDCVTALQPIAERVVAVAIPVHGDETEHGWALELPRLERLDLAGIASPGLLRASAWRTLDELSIHPTVARERVAAVAAVAASGLAPRLRCLRVYVDPVEEPDAVRRLAALPVARLEELRLELAAYGRPQSKLFDDLPPRAFPALRSVQLPGYDLGSLAGSSLAARIERLTTDGALEVQAEFPRAAISQVTQRPRPYWTHTNNRAPLALPQFEVGSRAVDAPDLTDFAEHAATWAWARRFWHLTRALLPARTSAPPRAFDAFTPFADDLGVELDHASLHALGPDEQVERVEAWRQRLGAAVGERHGEAFAPLFSLGVAAEGALDEIPVGGEPLDREDARRFVAESAALVEPLRTELAQVRAWCELIVARRVVPNTFEDGWFDARAWASVALAMPFVERDPAFTPPPPRAAAPKTTFETATRDHVVRRVILQWVGLVITCAVDRPTAFAGNAEEGTYFWTNMAGGDLAVAWSARGVVAIASDIYGDGDNTSVPREDALGKVPRALQPNVRALALHDAMSAFWISPRLRHRYVPDGPLPARSRGATGVFGAGYEHLEFFLSDSRFVAPDGRPSAEPGELAEALTTRILAGGGVLTAEQCRLLDTDLDGVARSEAQRAGLGAALRALGLRRPKPKKKR